jgi:hypothetical protein
MDVIDVLWFCAAHGNVGIVKCQADNGEIKYYIGQCSGYSEELDKKSISERGSRFPVDAGKVLFGDQ